MRDRDKQIRRDVLKKVTDTLHGSGIDGTWKQIETKHGIWLYNSFHCMDDHGMYCGWADFSLFFPWAGKLIDFRLRFHGAQSHYLARRKDLRPYLEDSVVHLLPNEDTPGVPMPHYGMGEEDSHE